MDSNTLKMLFTDARTHNGWLSKDIPDDLLQKVYDAAKFGPTSANCSPLRIVFIKSAEAKEKLKPCLAEGNIEKTMTAPVTAIFADDFAFYDHLPKLFPHADAKSWFAGNQTLIDITAFRNGTLQTAYFMLAARGFGLDCGPMSGFDNTKVDELFFKGTAIKSNFLCNLGYGDTSKLFPRSPRFDFNEVCTIA
ncbi:MAG: malonic semialdehyde reductase [Alphaproteobacteria bacterium]|nr:malonic semialdehyde reductase [Alphaproteobacteria bacterium]